jgi:hypothetical protein
VRGGRERKSEGYIGVHNDRLGHQDTHFSESILLNGSMPSASILLKLTTQADGEAGGGYTLNGRIYLSLRTENAIPQIGFGEEREPVAEVAGKVKTEVPGGADIELISQRLWWKGGTAY